MVIIIEPSLKYTSLSYKYIYVIFRKSVKRRKSIKKLIFFKLYYKHIDFCFIINVRFLLNIGHVNSMHFETLITVYYYNDLCMHIILKS